MKKIEPGMAYNMSKLNKLFALFSLILLLSVFWVFLDDYIRPWKAVQIKAMKIKQQKIDEKIEEFNKNLDESKLKQLEVRLEEGKKIVANRKGEIEKVQEELSLVVRDIKNETIVNGQLNSLVTETAFQWGVAHAEHKPNASKLFKKLKKYKTEFAASRDRLKTYTESQKKLNNRIEQLKKEILTNEKAIDDLLKTRKLLTLARKKTETGPIFAMRNAPLADYLDPTLKIQQVVVANVTDDRYFQHVPKVDRCITCHTFIDQKGYEDQANPFKTHPNLDLMVGKDSPHPLKQMGCTSCHGGEGHRVNDFNSAAHTPRNEEQKKEWIEKYHWHEPHKIPQVMYKVGHTEASCVKCHKGVQYIPQATVLNEGRRNIEKFGCYACHKIEGWEHKRKPGPSLEKIASKVTKDFFKSWVWSPKSFNQHAKMPSFFNQSNNSEPRFQKKNIAEVNAMAEYIWDKSKPYSPFMKFQRGNAEKGKELVKQVGCMGCHGVEGWEEASDKIDAYSGPYLTGTGSKVNGDWLVSWLKKPWHYQEDTIMPSFRLSDREARDIATYLLSLRNKKFEKLKFEEMDKGLRDEILVTYFSAFDTLDVAKKKLAAMDDRARTLELGKRSIGKYGCYSCHSIEGFDGRGPIGPELTNEGSKPLTQFGFGHEHDVEHSRDGWIKAHLINPRRWDNGADKPFKDLSRMPNFYMTEEEAESMTIAIIGQVSDKVPLKGMKQLNAHEKIAAEGMKTVINFNCIGCHQVDGMHGDILKMYEDDINEGPPRLVDQGHRVQSDWFHHFLDNVYPIRPWLKVRMPSFNLTNEEKNKIVSMFQAKAEQPTFVDNSKKIVWEPGERREAVRLFNALACTECHTQGFNNEEPQAPHLYYVKRRLRPSWIEKWLRNPNAILEGTLMPNFWEDGEPTEPDYFGGDTDKQIKALTKYILDIGHDRYSPNSPVTR